MRKGEACGLLRKHIDLDKSTVTIEQQLIRSGPPVLFGPLKKKRKKPTIHISPETVALLRKHLAEQRELKFANGNDYTDNGLVFAKTFAELTTNPGDALGMPLVAGSLGSPFARLVKKAQVRQISPHGLRHTTATLLLGAGVSVVDVAERLGHKDGSITLSVYGHALPDSQSKMTATLAKMLHG
jgi:integrase